MNSTILRYIFIALLVVTALFQLGFFYQILFTPDVFFEASGLPFDDINDYIISNRIIGVAQGFIIAITILAIYSTWVKNPMGIIAGILVGLHFIAIGFGVLGEAELGLAIFDIVRGTLTVVVGLLVLQKINQQVQSNSIN